MAELTAPATEFISTANSAAISLINSSLLIFTGRSVASLYIALPHRRIARGTLRRPIYVIYIHKSKNRADYQWAGLANGLARPVCPGNTITLTSKKNADSGAVLSDNIV